MPPRATDETPRRHGRHHRPSTARFSALKDAPELAALNETALCAPAFAPPRTAAEWRAFRGRTYRVEVWVGDDEAGMAVVAVGLSRRLPWQGYRMEYLAVGSAPHRFEALAALLERRPPTFAPCVVELGRAPGSRLDAEEVAAVATVLRCAGFGPVSGPAADAGGAAEPVLRMRRRGNLPGWALLTLYRWIEWG